MSHEIALTPTGHLLLREAEQGRADGDSGLTRRQIDAFASSASAGLFALAAEKESTELPPVAVYWRDYAARYLNALCRLPETGIGELPPIDPPVEAELMTELLSAPPMHGGEYLSAEVLGQIWVDLDSWVRGEISEAGVRPTEWLKQHAPRWHQVGRVCFHLAENKQNPDYPFAFLATYAPGLGRSGGVRYQPLGKALVEYAGSDNRQALVNLLTPVERASHTVDFVRELVETGDIYHPIAWTPAEAYRLLESVPLLEEAGLLVRLPDWWRARPRPRVAVTIGEQRATAIGFEAMLGFDVGLALGDERLTEDEVREILDSGDGLLRIRGRWVEVDREKLEAALLHWKQVEANAGSDGVSLIEAMRLLAGAPSDLKDDETDVDDLREWSAVNAGEWFGEVLKELRDPSGSIESAESPLFRGTLRPYQKTGRDWLMLLTRLRLGACLADDMGLGKTVQVLSLLLTVKEEKDSATAPRRPSLLVLPASLIANWRAEIERFAPDLETFYAHPSENDAATLEAVAGSAETRLADTNLVVTTYGMLLRLGWLNEICWRLVILDEAQAIKNPGARQTKAAKRLSADARIALTGTPVENRLSDLWSLFDFLCPGLLGSAARFKTFAKHLEARQHDRYAPLRNLVQPYILRRLKTDRSVIDDLPEKIEMKAYCALSRRQAALYAETVDELARLLAEVDGIKRRGLVLAYLTRFKQICNHPSHFTGDGVYAPEDSGKFARLGEICEEISSRQEKVLVFTQFREMTDPIVEFLSGVFDRPGVVLHGGTPVGRRRDLVDQFQREEGPPFFVLSLKAGGTGLNLTAASHVVHFDRWWNPAVENQATDRAFRIGQRKTVTVHSFVCRGTVEEQIDALIEEKTALADDLLSSGGEAMLTELSDEALLDIVSLDIDRAEQSGDADG